MKKRKRPIETIPDRPTEQKLTRIKEREKPGPILQREDESPISPSNRLGAFVTEEMTPFIDELLASYHTAKMADEMARTPYLQELRMVFETSFRILAEFQSEQTIKIMEEIQDGE